MNDEEIVERAPRLSLDVEVNCIGRGIAHSKNISKTGLLLITSEPLVVGNYIQMKFFLPDTQKEINAHGKVVRTNHVTDNFFESGINFWHIEDEDKQLLEQFFSSK